MSDRSAKWDEWLAREQRLLDQYQDESDVNHCPQRIGIRFVPIYETSDAKVQAVFVCEDRDAIFLRSAGQECWGCPDCDVRLTYPEADYMAKAASLGLKRLSSSMKRKWEWPWRRWFQSKKARISSKT